ncbi:YggT family protein [Bacillus sp. 2205SS5-2]|uniref:YggT family protein n=1 Tax=Bacillus sp. 2205SS5-2 TaxID=3109031 RepID=UPI0030047267
MDFVFSILFQVISLYNWALIIYILLSWFPNARESSVGQFLARICEPFLEPFRRIIPPLGVIDISPIVAIFTLQFAARGLASIANMF